jgi:hypothetical protein
MSDLRSLDLVAGLLFVGVATAQAFAASTIGQNPVPNFSSADLPWSPVGGVRPPASGLGPIGTVNSDIVRRELVNGNGDIADRRLELVDVKNANLKPWAAEALKKVNEEKIAGKRSYTAHASCLPAGVPEFLIIGGAFQAMYLIQSPREVVMVNSFDSQVRRVYMNAPHISNPKSSWYGDSVGHYEGDTLVVDTIGFNDKSVLTNGVPHTEQLHVVERFRLIENGTHLQVEFTVDDPGTFNAPWTGIVTYRHRGGATQLTETPCAESNAINGGAFFPEGTGSEVIPIPIANKPDF